MKWRPKHGNERTVPLCQEAKAIAQRALAASKTPWLFSRNTTRRKRAGQYTPGGIRAAVKRTMKVAGIVHGTTHTFRHAFCSFMANSNVPALKVMKMLGHRSLNILLTHYHVDDKELFAAFDEVDFSRMLTTRKKEVLSTDNDPEKTS